MSILRSIVERTSIHGRRLGLGALGELVGNEKELTSPTVDCAITVGAEGASVADQRAITVQLKDIDGNAIAYRELVELVVLLDANGSDFVATGGSTGIAIGANGKLLTMVTKKLFKAVSDATGLITLTWTDSGTEVAFLGVQLPNGRIVISAALTNA
jgi:hypothetical protein